LYANDTLVKVSNNADFNWLDYTISKNQSVNFKILADFANSIGTGSTFEIKVLTGSVQARNIDSGKDITPAGSAVSGLFTFSAGGEALVTRNSSQSASTIIAPSTGETSVFKFDIEAEDDNLLVTDLYLKNVAETWSTASGVVDLSASLRSSSLVIDGKTITWDIVSSNTIHFGLGSNGLKVNKDSVVTWDVKVAFYDSSTRSNLNLQLAIPTGTDVTWVSGTKNGIRILSESTGTEIDRGNTPIVGNVFLLARSKPVVALSTFTPSSSDAYRFSVTANSNRKLTLNELKVEVGWTVTYTGGTIVVYRDSIGSSNIIGSGTLATGKVTITLNGTASKEVAAGSTVTYYVQFENSTGYTGEPTREVRISELKYTDDVTNAPVIDATLYNVWVPTNVSSYKY
jgi:hypothetical protein